MNTVVLLKTTILVTITYPVVARIWRNLQRPSESLSESERLASPLWRRQALGVAIAAAGLVAMFVLPLLPGIPFEAIYIVIGGMGAGVLLTVHARTLEARLTSPQRPISQERTTSDRFDIAWKVALIGSCASFFASLSLSSLRSYAWLAHPFMVATYVLLGVGLVSAALSGWTRVGH
jgi:hypothetical protein